MRLRELRLLPLAGLVVLGGCGREVDEESSPLPARRSAIACVSEPVRQRPVKPKLLLESGDDDSRTPAERSLAAAIENALDEESLSNACQCASAALKCGDVEIRQAMVDTLGWFGKDALPELTPFLSDVDEDVRDCAQNEWAMAVADIDDEVEKIAVVEQAMNILNDEDFLDDVSGEYIGVDEKLAVESLVHVITANGSPNGVSKAKETYEMVTGDEWQDEESALQWLKEEYLPPEE